MHVLFHRPFINLGYNIMKFLKNLLICVFIISSSFLISGLNAQKSGNLNKFAKEELQDEFDTVLKDVLSRLSPSTKKVVLNEIKLTAGALISGVGMGYLAYLYSEGALDRNFERPYQSEASGIYIGLAGAVLSYVLLKVVDKTIMNPKSDIENKVRLLEVISLLLNNPDKNSAIDGLRKFWPFQ